MSAAPSAARKGRRQAVRDFKRTAILEAARAVLRAKGRAGATIRAIAEEAGYTPGALYAYFPSKEAIEAELLAEAFAALAHSAKRAREEARGEAGARLRAVVNAVGEGLRGGPDLLALAQTVRPDSLPAETERHLNGRLIALLQVIADALGGCGAPAGEATNRETVALMAHILGLALLERSGRLDVLGFPFASQREHYLDALLARLA